MAVGQVERVRAVLGSGQELELPECLDQRQEWSGLLGLLVALLAGLQQPVDLHPQEPHPETVHLDL
jgi:hypothetical protein